MRRCQRLPDVTHPVDSTRPASLLIKSRASRFTLNSTQNRPSAASPSCPGDGGWPPARTVYWIACTPKWPASGFRPF